ncbi:ATP-binding cassette domain-containing protein [Erysipelothrix sp. HDW6B]|uniref:ABC transporter ATP-binding protein n=1 Tax=Erysipelothrix TaxID=1647 RepID=UPI00135778DD|nr:MULTISPECIES: ATP-binding cassette domain-containing protein [Erysipelothrix]QIK86149.1 ATP-binding cassette domain-containing protein [Erysipelothrix sp. HDW6B]
MKLTFHKVNKYFGEKHVLKDISFTVKSGQIFGYLGRNGAGKTTSLRILMDVFAASDGTITMDDKPFKPGDYKIGYLPEERGMYSKTLVKDQLLYFAMLRGATRQHAQESIEYWSKKFGVDIYLNSKLETLSKGNQQKVQITQAFLNEPDILILDEPFSGLDPVNSQVFQDALTEYISDDRIIIFSSHQMSYVETFCDDIAIINFGQIILKGSLEAIKQERGMNKVKLALNTPNDAFEQLLNTKGVTVEHDHKTMILTLPEAMTHQELLEFTIKEGMAITLFSDYTPSLHDIFVDVAGGTNA